MDRQLKVRGFRVEPGEIESVLAGHPDIDQVSVVASARGSGDTSLVAYYTPSAGATARAGTGTHHPPAATFRNYLYDRLPGYMIPASFIARQRLPTSPERDQADAHPTLPRPRAPRHGERPTPTQAGLAALWARLLRRERIGLDDDFFALGGNSLLAAEILASTHASFRIPADSVRPLTRCLLRDPTLRRFAAAVQDARSGRLGGDVDQPEIDLAGEAMLDVSIRRDGARSRPRPDWRSPREILLTGATGFLGAHLLRELLAATDARVWCTWPEPETTATRCAVLRKRPSAISFRRRHRAASRRCPLIDAQWDGPLLRSLGAVPMARERYLQLLDRPPEPLSLPGGRLPAERLLPAP
jgi:hypothetical protein